jgi:hypothetical protein
MKRIPWLLDKRYSRVLAGKRAQLLANGAVDRRRTIVY